MSAFFKAWAAYCGILTKLAPYGVQGDLATSLYIYTMNLYDLLEKYIWEGVKSYHFQFHRKRVASGKNIYHPTEWRQLDSQLIAAKCFAHIAPRAPCAPTQKPGIIQTQRTNELPIHDSAPGSSYSHPPSISTTHHPPAERRSNYVSISTQPPTGSMALISQATQRCRNWNYRECLAVSCRYQHTCIGCGSSHRVSQCTLGNNGPPTLSSNNLSGR